jgi:hypothetical protein
LLREVMRNEYCVVRSWRSPGDSNNQLSGIANITHYIFVGPRISYYSIAIQWMLRSAQALHKDGRIEPPAPALSVLVQWLVVSNVSDN